MAVCNPEQCAVGVDIDRNNMLQQAAELAYPDGLCQRGHMVAAVCFQSQYLQFFIPGSRMDKAMENTCQGDLPIGYLPAALCAPERTILENLAVLLIESNLGFHPFYFHGKQVL